MMKLGQDLPMQIDEIIRAVCESSGASKQKPPHLIIPLGRGNGRTRVARIIAECYREVGVRRFSSRESFLDYRPNGTMSNIDEIYLDIQTNCEYANEYNGIIAFDADDLLPKLNDMVGDKFFEMVDKIKHSATLIIYLPVVCQKAKLDTLLDRVGVSFRLLPPVEPLIQDIAKIFWENLPRDIREGHSYKKYERGIISYITKKTECPTYKAAIETAQAFHVKPEAQKILFDIAERSKTGWREIEQEKRYRYEQRKMEP